MSFVGVWLCLFLLGFLVGFVAFCAGLFTLTHSSGDSVSTRMDKGKNRIEYDDDCEEPLHIGGTHEPNDETVALCLLGKLFREWQYNTYGLFETMEKLWCPSKGMICRELGSNLLSFQFKCRRDMEKVIGMDPWHFNKHILVLKKISNEIQPSL